MPRYEFQGCDNGKCPGKNGHPKKVITYSIPYSMKDVPDLGQKIPCPHCRKGKIKRILSSGIVGIVRKPAAGDPSGSSFMTNIGGQETAITFVDHPHTDPNYQIGMEKTAESLGVKGAYFNEQQGRMCVDVESTVVDPLGKMKRGNLGDRQVVTQKEKINTPVTVKKSGKRPISKVASLPSMIPVRR